MLRGLPRNQKSVSYKCLAGLARGSLLVSDMGESPEISLHHFSTTKKSGFQSS